MGMYAWLELSDFECSACGKRSDFTFQYKWATVDCVTRYSLGDKLTWDGYAYGEQGHHLVVTYVIATTACTHCGGPPDGEENLDIFVENDVITAVRWTDWEHEELFAVLDDYPPGLTRVQSS
ncbi:hypothetical protein AB0M48_34320 [Lentzea sp. NPDC051208]|uniref:hypothetical protein n=1 Tax=Lentzea sp. NPDC051208 TaxID=3154642 RepID=UPI0034183294